MNVLCLCDHGEVRSVAMAIVLRERGHFAVAGSYDNYNDTKGTPIFDMVMFMQEGGLNFIGRDEYGDPRHPDLVLKCVLKAKELGL